MHVSRTRKQRVRTACLECQRRKQKCDQKQPCRYCLRRFPPVECMYTSVGRNTPRSHSSHVSHDVSVGSSSEPEALDSSDQKKFHISMVSLESFAQDPDGYQNLLSSMVSRISGGVLSSDIDSAASPSTDSESRPHEAVNTQTGSALSETTSNVSVKMRSLRAKPKIYPPTGFSISLVDPLHYLGITPTNQNGQLFQAFIKLISKYVFSIDGNPGPNYYNDYWVQWCMKSPLLAHLGMFTASCYQAAAQHVLPSQSSTVIGYKLKAIAILNDTLSSKDMSTSNEAITGVVYLIVNEWYWSCSENIQAHMSGLREMIRLRGGLGDMGMHDFVKKIVVLCDYYISCSDGSELSFPHNIPLVLSCPPHTSSPLLYSQVQFAHIHAELKIGRETALILEDMSFLIQAVIKQQIRESTDLEKLKLTKTSIWIRNRIIETPDGSTKDHPLAGDFLYKSCRIAALIYCNAIVERSPLSVSCTLQDLNRLWTTMWRITLTRWKQIPGIFLFIILSANQAAQSTPHGRLLKSMFKASTSYMALDNWEVVDRTLSSYMTLQRWLDNGETGDEVPLEPEALEYMHVYQR